MAPSIKVNSKFLQIWLISPHFLEVMLMGTGLGQVQPQPPRLLVALCRIPPDILSYLPELLGDLLELLQDAFQLPDDHFHPAADPLPLAFAFAAATIAAAAAGGVTGLPVLAAPGVHPSLPASAPDPKGSVHPATPKPGGLASAQPLSAGELSPS